jgi:Zn/Cd-binding protein ZinT
VYILTYEQKKGKKKKASPNKAAAKPTKRPAFAKQPADAEAKRRRRGRGFDERLSDARMADLDGRFEEIKAKEEDTAMQKAMSKKATAAAKKDAAKVPRPPYPLFVCNVIY